MPTSKLHANETVAILARRREVAELYLTGLSIGKIAEKVGIKPYLVTVDLQEIRKAWVQESIELVGAQQSVELQKIDHLETEYWGAWERSKKDAEKTFTEEHQEVVGGVTITKRRTNIEKTGQVGGRTYLQGVEWCIQKRCDLLGLDAPRRSDITSKDRPVLDIAVWQKAIEQNKQQMLALPDDVHED